MDQSDHNKKIEKGHRERKHWKITSAEGKTLKFFPMFIKNEETNEVECRNLEMKFTDAHHHEHVFTFDWMNIFQFVYFTANEELRQKLASRYERKATYVPYDLTIRVSPEEAKKGTATRRVNLPLDEVAMALAREESWKIMLRNKGKAGDPSAFRYKK